MNFQVTILKVLVSYPDGFASLPDLKRDIANEVDKPFWRA